MFLRLTPPVEALLEDGHLPKTTTAAAAGGEEDIGGCLSLNEDSTAHGDPTAQLSRNVSKEPVLRHAEAWVRVESLNQEPGVPERDGSMWESRGADDACKLSLQPADLVFEVLRLLTESTSRRIRANRFDGVSDTLYLAFHAVADYGEVGREGAVVIDE